MNTNMKNINISNDLNLIDFENDIILNKTDLNLEVNLPFDIFNMLNFNNILLKNKFCFIGKSDELFINKENELKDEYFNFYLEVAKSGVGLIFTGGLPTKFYNDGNDKISKALLEKKNKIKEFVSQIHLLGSKIFYTLKSSYGRADDKNALIGLFNYSASSNRNFNNANVPCKKISDGKCEKIIESLYFQAVQSLECNFDGIMIDGNLFSLMGEFSSFEMNNRKLGYFLEIEDFSNKLLTKILSKNKTTKIIYSFSFKTFVNEVFGNDYNRIISIKKCKNNVVNSKIFTFLANLVKLGVDGFFIQAGTFETEFLSVSTELQKDNILSNLFIVINEYFKKNNIKNKFGNEVFFIYNDFLYDVNDEIKTMDNIIFDFSRQILADNKILYKLRNNKAFLNCIKCGKCDNKFNLEYSTKCILSPNFDLKNTYFANKHLNNSILDCEDLSLKNKKVAVIGGGLSGIYCTLFLLKRGYSVDLFEKRNMLNYNNKLCEIFGYNYLLKNFNKFLENELNSYLSAKNLQINLNSSFNISDINKYDKIIVATGFNSKFLNIPGAVLQNVKNIYEVLENEEFFCKFKNIVIDAKSELSINLAQYLLLKNKNVTILFQDIDFLFKLENSKLTYYLFSLKKLNANILILPKIKRIESDFVEILINSKFDNFDFQSLILNLRAKKRYKTILKAKNIDMDIFIYEPEIYSNNKTYIDIVSSKFSGEVFLVGNALQPCDFTECIKTAFFVARNI